MGACDVLIAVIGQRWLISSEAEGSRRLDNSDDFVRLEIATALKRNIRVIPVLVDDASMPRASDLPDDLKSLVRRNAVEVSHTRFSTDSERLIDALERVFEKTAAEQRGRRQKEERDRLKTEQRQHEKKERLEHVPQSQLSSPIAPSTPPAQPEADKTSSETPKVVHPLPPKPAESKHEKPQPPSSGATPGKSPSKQVIAFLAIPAVLVVAGLVYLATRVSQSPPPQPSSVVAVTPSPPVIATPTAEEKAPYTPEVAVQPTTQPTASVAMAIPSPRSVPKSWNLVGTWRANAVEQGVAMEITLNLRPDGTSTYYFRSQLGQTQVDGTWRYSNNVLYEEFGNGGRGQAALDWITDNQFELTIIDNGIPAYSGLKRIYHRL